LWSWVIPSCCFCSKALSVQAFPLLFLLVRVCCCVPLGSLFVVLSRGGVSFSPSSFLLGCSTTSSHCTFGAFSPFAPKCWGPLTAAMWDIGTVSLAIRLLLFGLARSTCFKMGPRRRIVKGDLRLGGTPCLFINVCLMLRYYISVVSLVPHIGCP